MVEHGLQITILKQHQNVCKTIRVGGVKGNKKTKNWKPIHTRNFGQKTLGGRAAQNNGENHKRQTYRKKSNRINVHETAMATARRKGANEQNPLHAHTAIQFVPQQFEYG